MTASLMWLTYKEKFNWRPQAEKTFQNLTTTLTTALILIHPNFSKFFYMKSDAPNFALKIVLLEIGDDKNFIYFSIQFEKKISC